MTSAGIPTGPSVPDWTPPATVATRLASVESSITAIQARQVWLNDYASLVVGGVWDAALDAAIAALAGSRGTIHVATLTAGASYTFDLPHTLAHGQYIKGPASRSGVPAANFICRYNGIQWIVDAGNGSGFEGITFTGDVTKTGQDPLVDLGHASNPISSGVFRDCLVQSSGGHGIRCRNLIAWDLRRTYAVSCELSGWKVQGFSNLCKWEGAGATNNKRWGVDWYGGSADHLDTFQFENNSLEDVGQAVTAAAATDLFSKTAHGYIAGDRVVFSGLTGGAGITAGTGYYVITAGLTADAFKVSTTAEGTALDVTSDLTAGTAKRAYGGLRVRGGADQDYPIDLVATAPRFENNDGPTGAGVPFQIDAELGSGANRRTAVKFTGDYYSLDNPPAINGGVFHSTCRSGDNTVLGVIGTACRGAIWELPTMNSGSSTMTITDPNGKGQIRHSTHWVVGADSQVAWGFRENGDTANRLIIIPKAGGGPQIQAGPGNAGLDVNLDRAAAGLWGTDHALYLRGTGGGSYIRMAEQSADPAATVNEGKLFCKDSGGGKTQLAVRFGTGATQILATEP